MIYILYYFTFLYLYITLRKGSHLVLFFLTSKTGDLDMAKKRCSHIGRISKRRVGGLIKCHRFNVEVRVEVGEIHNLCTHKSCPFSKKEIARFDD